MDILIFGGQSNMQGQTESCPDTMPIAGAREYRFATDTMQPLCHPVGEDFDELLLAAHEGHGSLVPAFCKAYIAETKRQVVAVHVAKGATTMADWHPSGIRYAFALQKITAAIRKAESEDSIERIYYVWLQGESDALAGTTRQAYATALSAYKDALKRDIGIDRFGILRVGFFTSEPARDLTIMAAQEDVARVDGDCVLLTRIAGRLSREKAYLNPYAAGHYNNAGMELLGTVAGKALGRLAMGATDVADEETVAEL